MENPLFRIRVNKDLNEMKQRELELSEEEWFQMQFLESQLRGISMEPTSMKFIQFLGELEEKKADWERRKWIVQVKHQHPRLTRFAGGLPFSAFLKIHRSRRLEALKKLKPWQLALLPAFVLFYTLCGLISMIRVGWCQKLVYGLLYPILLPLLWILYLPWLPIFRKQRRKKQR